MSTPPEPDTLPKAPTGIAGFDEITEGGLPAGRPSLICGAAGCGKTLFGITFLVNGATRFNEPGVFMSFEERGDDLAANVKSLGFDLGTLAAGGKLVIDHVRFEPSEIQESGEYSLEGLFVRIGHAVDTIGAKRLVLDTLETLFGGVNNLTLLRSELRRLFGWLKDRGLTTVITGERGGGDSLTRQGLEEYVSDFVAVFDNRIQNQRSTRLLFVAKYRGSAHGTDEYPFLIDHEGIKILPASTTLQQRPASNDIISSGIPDLDAMFSRGGWYRGSSTLLSGVAGAGKTTFGTVFVDAACTRGERCMFFGLEEGTEENCRNALSIGIDLAKWVAADLLHLEASRPCHYGLETHLTRIHRDLDSFQPSAVVIDPISAFRGPDTDVQLLLVRMVNLFKSRGITALFTGLQSSGPIVSGQGRDLSTLMDNWIRLINVDADDERATALYIIKSRGMGHSKVIREYTVGPTGVTLLPDHIGLRFVSSADVAPPHAPALPNFRSESEGRDRAGLARAG
jgi:circadian clock protein KaiC